MSPADTLYVDGEYAAKNPSWHVEDSPFKAKHILRALTMLQRPPRTVCEIGCGAGEILRQLDLQLPPESVTELIGYDVSPQAIELARPRESARTSFVCGDLRNDSRHFDVCLCIDVFEHIEDCFGFLRQLKAKSRYKIFHVPLDLSVQTVFRKNGLRKRRQLHEHLHYFTKETTLQALHDTGYEVLDCFYTARGNDLGTALVQRLLKLPRRLFFALHKDIAVRLLGGYSLLVLTR